MRKALPPVVVTRPLAQAEPLAERIRAIGRAAIVFPLLEILPLADMSPLRARLAMLNQYAMVAFVSPNAIDFTLPLAQPWPRSVPIAVVGAGSRRALAKYGVTEATAQIFSPRDPERTDSETLVAQLDLDALRGRTVLIVRGETGREFLAEALGAAGVQVEQVAAYRRQQPQLGHEGQLRLRQLLEDGAEWLITSSESLRNLRALALEAAGAEGVAALRRQQLVVPHFRIAQTAAELGCTNVLLVGSGDDQLLAALQSCS